MIMVKAVINGEVIAESNNTVIVDRKYYFPAGDVKEEVLEPSSHQTVCPWKGTASYYHVKAGGERNENAAWYYPNPSEKAKNIEGKIAFSYIHGIDTIED